MNILLLQPESGVAETYFPLGLAYIASSLKKSSHSVFGIDCAFCDFNSIIELIKNKNIGLVGISSNSYNYLNALTLSRKIKSGVKIPIVMGGAHCTLFAESIIKEQSIDYVIEGDGEDAILELVEALEKRGNPASILSLAYKDSEGNPCKNASRPLLEDISGLAHPAREIFRIKSYHGINSRNRYYSPIITSRGCIHQCSYCPTHRLMKRWRGREASEVVDEIESVLNNNRIREFHIEDNNFMADPERVSEICRELIKRKLNIAWQCTNGIYPHDLPPPLIKEMAEAGCYRIALGIESFNKALLEKLNRRLDIEKVQEIISQAHRYSMEVTGYFTLGLPEETLESINNTVEESKRMGLDLMLYSLFRIIPGSEIFEETKHRLAFKKIIDAEVSLCDLKIEKLRLLRRNAYLGLLLNPRVYKYTLKSLTSRGNIKNIILKTGSAITLQDYRKKYRSG